MCIRDSYTYNKDCFWVSRSGCEQPFSRRMETVSYTHLDVYKRQGLVSVEAKGKLNKSKPSCASSKPYFCLTKGIHVTQFPNRNPTDAKIAPMAKLRWLVKYVFK